MSTRRTAIVQLAFILVVGTLAAYALIAVGISQLPEREAKLITAMIGLLGVVYFSVGSPNAGTQNARSVSLLFGLIAGAALVNIGGRVSISWSLLSATGVVLWFWFEALVVEDPPQILLQARELAIRQLRRFGK